MAKLLRTKDRILLGIALMGDIFDEMRLLGGLVSKKYELVYGWIPPAFRKSTYYKNISRLLRTGDLEKVVEKGQAVLRITGQGAKRMVRKFPFIKIASKKWDGKWTIFMFDIEEVIRSKRDRLRKRLITLTFAKLQRSVYTTPHDFVAELREWVEFLGLKGKVRIFRAEEVTGENPKDLVEKLWKISKLNDAYQGLLDQLQKGRELRGKKREKLCQRLKSELLEIVVKDPFLPQELLPKDWVGAKARKIIGSL